MRVFFALRHRAVRLRVGPERRRLFVVPTELQHVNLFPELLQSIPNSMQGKRGNGGLRMQLSAKKTPMN
jgi:hypothetical protein